uniref:Uncharacterized protein n=1 Tax=Anguilla anguilla TaxID=7936 RepID=A0A0E9XLG5_ANGAN
MYSVIHLTNWSFSSSNLCIIS